MPRAVDQELETVGTGDERVLEVVGGLDDAIERADLVHLAVLPGEAGAGEDEVNLLRRAVRVRRGRQLAGCDSHAVDADARGARSATEHLPHGVHLALRRAALLDVVPVRQAHAVRLLSERPAEAGSRLRWCEP